MGHWLASVVAIIAVGLVASETAHNIVKRQSQYPQRGRPPQRFRTGFQVAPDPAEAVTEYTSEEQPYLQAPRYARVSTGIRGSQQPSFTVTDQVDHQPPDYDQEAPAPRYAEGPATPYGPQRRRPQYPISPAPPARGSEVPRGPSLTQQDLAPVSYATPRRPPQAPPAPPPPPPPASYEDQEDEEPSPPVAPPARTVLISQAPVPSRPPLNFGGAVQVPDEQPASPTQRPQRGRGSQRRPAAQRTTAAPTTAAPPPPPAPTTRRAGSRRPVVRLQNTQSNPTPPPPSPRTPSTTRPAPSTTPKRPSAPVAYDPDSNLAPPPDEEEFNQPAPTETSAGRKFTKRPPVEDAPTPPPTTRPSSTRRPGGKRLKIGTLPSRPTTTTTTEAPDEEDYDDQPPPPPPPRPNRRPTTRGSRGPKPAVVFEEPSETQEEEVARKPVRPRVSGRPTNKAFKPKPVEDYEDDTEDARPKPSTRSESSRPASTRFRSRDQDYEEDYEDEEEERPASRSRSNSNNGKYKGRFRSREDREREDSSRGSRGRGRPGPPTSPKPTRRVPPKDLPKRKDGRIVDYLGDPNFPRELSGYDLTDYPFYVSLPDDVGNFDCEERANGFYASVPHQCQVFHYCFGGNRYSFLCANYTLYDQTTFTCQFANKVNCVSSERWYSRNDDLYKEEKKDDKDKASGDDEDGDDTKEVKAPSRGGNSGSSSSATSSQAKKKSKS